MRSTYRVLAYLLAALVLVQAAAIAYALAGLGAWIDDGNELTKAVIEDESSDVGGGIGFMIHFMNGLLVGLLSIVLLIVSFFTKFPGAVKNAAIILGLVLVQIFLGIFSHSVPGVIVLHAINAFAIFSFAAMIGIRMRNTAAPETLSAPAAAHV